MDVDIKEEPPLEIEGYMLMDATMDQNIGFPDAAEDPNLRFSEDDQNKPKKKRKRSKKNENIAPFDANDDMQQLLQEWGLEILSERFSKNLIDLTVLDYIVDVDIVDLCRDLPIRYRLILRHKLAEKRGKCDSDSDEQKGHASFLRYMNAFEKSRKKPLQNQTQDDEVPKRDICPVDLVLNKPFIKRSEDEKRLLVSMEIPRPSLPELKSSYKKGNSTMTRSFYKSRYEAEWWLCGSRKRNKLFCWPCMLFNHPEDPSNGAWSKRGFNDLNHLSASLKYHRTSQKHVDNADAYMSYGNLPTTTDNETAAPYDSATVSDTVANQPKRSIKRNAKVTSNGSTKQANVIKVATKLSQ